MPIDSGAEDMAGTGAQLLIEDTARRGTERPCDAQLVGVHASSAGTSAAIASSVVELRNLHVLLPTLVVIDFYPSVVTTPIDPSGGAVDHVELVSVVHDYPAAVLLVDVASEQVVLATTWPANSLPT